MPPRNEIGRNLSLCILRELTARDKPAFSHHAIALCIYISSVLRRKHHFYNLQQTSFYSASEVCSFFRVVPCTYKFFLRVFLSWMHALVPASVIVMQEVLLCPFYKGVEGFHFFFLPCKIFGLEFRETKIFFSKRISECKSHFIAFAVHPQLTLKKKEMLFALIYKSAYFCIPKCFV